MLESFAYQCVEILALFGTVLFYKINYLLTAETPRRGDNVNSFLFTARNSLTVSVLFFLLFQLSALIVPLIALNMFPLSTLQLPQSLYLLNVPALCYRYRKKWRHCKIFLTRNAIWRGQSFNYHSRGRLEKNLTLILFVNASPCFLLP